MGGGPGLLRGSQTDSTLWQWDTTVGHHGHDRLWLPHGWVSMSLGGLSTVSEVNNGQCWATQYITHSRCTTVHTHICAELLTCIPTQETWIATIMRRSKSLEMRPLSSIWTTAEGEPLHCNSRGYNAKIVKLIVIQNCATFIIPLVGSSVVYISIQIITNERIIKTNTWCAGVSMFRNHLWSRLQHKQ